MGNGDGMIHTLLWAQFCEHAKKTVPVKVGSYAEEWYDDENADTILGRMASGYDKLVPEAEKLVSKLEVATPETSLGQWLASPCGAYPIVAEALAGFPEPMRRWQQTQSECGPVRVVVSTTSSGAFSASELMARGTAILALVLKLQAIRPVSLTVTVDLGSYRGDHETILEVTMDSAPIDLARACYALTSAGFSRGAGYSVAQQTFNANGSWPEAFRRNQRTYPKYIAAKMGLGEQDIYVPPIMWGDKVIADPVKWVTERLAVFGAVD